MGRSVAAGGLPRRGPHGLGDEGLRERALDLLELAVVLRVLVVGVHPGHGRHCHSDTA
jgi:hypothetical protein